METTKRRHHDLDWDQLDLKKFFALTIIPSSVLRFITYPVWVVKTRLQVQQVRFIE